MQNFVRRTPTFKEEATRIYRNKKLTQAKLAVACGISTVTLRRYLDKPLIMPLGTVYDIIRATDCNDYDRSELWNALREEVARGWKYVKD